MLLLLLAFQQTTLVESTLLLITVHTSREALCVSASAAFVFGVPLARLEMALIGSFPILVLLENGEIFVHLIKCNRWLQL